MSRKQNSRQARALFALVVLCTAGSGWAQKVAPRRTLETAHEAHSLTPAEAANAYPVHLRAVVTYYDPYIDARHGALFVHDRTGSIFVRVPARPILPLHPGTQVDVRGVTGAGDYAPIVDEGQVEVVGEGRIPPSAPRVTMAQLLSGSEDGQWVEVAGVVHAVHVMANNVVLDLATAEGQLSATTLSAPGTNDAALIDATIRIHGNAAPVFNRKRQMVGVHIFFPSSQEVTVIHPAPPDPFGTPTVSLSHLLRFSPDVQVAHRVHVRGRVTLSWPGRTLCIQQNSDGLCMDSDQTSRVRAGDLVDVIGFPGISGYEATLENATFRASAAPAVPPPAVPVTAAQAFAGEGDGERVRIDGELIGQDWASGDFTLMLSSGKFLFPVILPKETASGVLPWKAGSQLRITGVSRLLIDPERTNLGEGAVRPGSVEILLNSMDDVEVLRAPSWWTPEHALAVLGIALGVAFAALAWIVVLRRRVAQQTQALRRSEASLRHLSEHDPLTGLPNRLLLNDRLSVALQRATRFREGLAVLVVDLDRFKEVNDQYGHQAGDRLLCEAARQIKETVRMTDTVARIGGDEFIVLLQDLHQAQEAEAVAAKIVEAVSAPVDVGAAQASVTVSVGVSTYPEGGANAEQLLHSADLAMYEAKARGRNRFRVHEPVGLS